MLLLDTTYTINSECYTVEEKIDLDRYPLYSGKHLHHYLLPRGSKLTQAAIAEIKIGELFTLVIKSTLSSDQNSSSMSKVDTISGVIVDSDITKYDQLRELVNALAKSWLKYYFGTARHESGASLMNTRSH
jgi:hypothetical protein